MKIKGLNAFQIKIIALLLMTIDHVGHFFFPDVLILRIIGRISAPLFLFILVWSFDYTRDKWKMFIRLYVCMLVLDLIWLPFTYKSASYLQKPNILSLFLVEHALGVIRYAEYGWLFVVLGVLFYIFKEDKKKLAGYFFFFTLVYEVLKMTAPFTRLMWYVSYHIGYDSFIFNTLNWVYRFFVAYDYRRTPIVLHGLCLKDIQWFMIFSLPIMLLYNNEKGRGWKWFFYVYYVLHVVLFFYLSVFVL